MTQNNKEDAGLLQLKEKGDLFCRLGIQKMVTINKEKTIGDLLKNVTKYNLLPQSHLKKQREKYAEVLIK